MSCCEKLKYERLQNIEHASVLASQEAGLRNRTIAVVKKEHKDYGPYFIGVDYEQAKREGVKIFREYKPGKSMAIQKGSGNRKRKVSANPK